MSLRIFSLIASDAKGDLAIITKPSGDLDRHLLAYKQLIASGGEVKSGAVVRRYTECWMLDSRRPYKRARLAGGTVAAPKPMEPAQDSQPPPPPPNRDVATDDTGEPDGAEA